MALIKPSVLVVLMMLAMAPAVQAQTTGGSFYRAFYVTRSLASDVHVADIEDLAARASNHGFDTIVLSLTWDKARVQPHDFERRLRETGEACRRYNLRVIARIASFSYGRAILAVDPNLAAALPVRDVPFVVRDGVAHFDINRTLVVDNGSFEAFRGDRAAGFDLQERPGKVSFIDDKVAAHGSVSLRLQDFDKSLEYNGRVMQRIDVAPFRTYRVTVWMRARDLRASPMVEVRADDGRVLAQRQVDLVIEGEWYEIRVEFNSLDAQRVRLYAGVWGADGGYLWLDDLAINEIELRNVLGRASTPLVVRNARSGEAYEYGHDYVLQVARRAGDAGMFESPFLKIESFGRISDGERLLVSYYQALELANGQVAVCMSQPQAYRVVEADVLVLARTLQPDGYFIGLDEMRQGGWCESCVARGVSAGHILADCLRRQYDFIRGVKPDAVVLAWSDMLDPLHNARDSFWQFNGDFSGAAQYIPDDIVMVCWYHHTRAASLRFFSDAGFEVLAAAYYDEGDLVGTLDWLDALRAIGGGSGIMYTTWRDDYSLLEMFGDTIDDSALVERRR